MLYLDGQVVQCGRGPHHRFTLVAAMIALQLQDVVATGRYRDLLVVETFEMVGIQFAVIGNFIVQRFAAFLQVFHHEHLQGEFVERVIRYFESPFLAAYPVGCRMAIPVEDDVDVAIFLAAGVYMPES